VKWGVIGAGGIAERRTIPEMTVGASNSTLVAVMDIDANAVSRVKDKYKVPYAYTSEVELLDNEEVQAVYVASPVFAHAPQVLEAAKRGKHILCEKPLAGTIEQATAMVDACVSANISLGLCFQMRLNRYHQKARDLVAQGALGRVVLGRAQLTCWYPPIPGAWRQNRGLGYGGAMMDMGPHCVDVIEYILGEPVVAVSSVQSSHIHRYDAEDTSVALLEFASGAIGVLDTSFAIPDEASHNALEIYGERGSLLAQGTLGQTPTGKMVSHIVPTTGGYKAKQNRYVTNVEQEGYDLDGPPLYGELVRLFAESLLNGVPLVADGLLGLHNLRVILGIYEAARRGSKITV
jgi:predicted dehydrogenase